MPPVVPHRPAEDIADGLAAGTSLLCIVHCLTLPVLIALFPAFAGALGVAEELHVLLFLIAVPISSYAIAAGWRKHGAWLPLLLAAAGLVLIGFGAFGGLPEVQEIGITIAGSVLLAIAHYRNWQARRAPRAR